VTEMGTTMDLLPTFFKLSGSELPGDRIYDGYDLTSVLKGEGSSGREVVFYYRGDQVFAIRKGNFKAHFITQPEYGSRTAHPITVPAFQTEKAAIVQDPPLLYNLAKDPGERYNIAKEHPDIIDEIETLMEEHLKSIKAVENQLEK